MERESAGGGDRGAAGILGRVLAKKRGVRESGAEPTGKRRTRPTRLSISFLLQLSRIAPSLELRARGTALKYRSKRPPETCMSLTSLSSAESMRLCSVLLLYKCVFVVQVRVCRWMVVICTSV